MTSRWRVAQWFWALTPVAGLLPSAPKTRSRRKRGNPAPQDQENGQNLLNDVDQCFTLREPCVASLRSDRHQIGMTDRHHRNPQVSNAVAAAHLFRMRTETNLRVQLAIKLPSFSTPFSLH